MPHMTISAVRDQGAGTRAAPASAKGPLGSEYVIRSAQGAEDVERVAALTRIVHDPGVAALTRALFLHHPATTLSDLLFVEHRPSQQVVSTLCLIPWAWRVEGVDLPAAEMGIVGTLEPHRHRGLIGALVDRFDERVVERGCVVSHIQGIPGFYQRYGYEFCLPLEGGLRLELRDVPPSEGQGHRFRPAGVGDIPVLSALYDEAASDLSISAVRDGAIWRYLLDHSTRTETACERWLVYDAEGEAVGYFTVPEHHFGEELVITEASRMRYRAALDALRHASALARQRARPGIRLNLPPMCTLARLARSLGGQELGTYAWQVKVQNRERSLRALAPALERRLAASPFAGLTQTATVGLYSESYGLRFEAGRLAGVDRLSRARNESIMLPANRFVQLLLGSHSREDLEARNPDVRSTPADRLLIDTLFPKVAAFLYQPY
jgi:hypothetical protein